MLKVKFNHPEWVERMFMLAARGTGWIYHNSDPSLKAPAADASEVRKRVWREILVRLEFEWLEEPYANDLMTLMDIFDGEEIASFSAEALRLYPPFPNQPKSYEPVVVEMATPKQVAYLRNLGYTGEIPTKAQASIIIDDLKNNRMAA